MTDHFTFRFEQLITLPIHDSVGDQRETDQYGDISDLLKPVQLTMFSETRMLTTNLIPYVQYLMTYNESMKSNYLKPYIYIVK